MKTKVILQVLFISLSLFTLSCTKNEDQPIVQSDALKQFEKNFNTEFSQLNYGFIQDTKSIEFPNKSEDQISFSTIPVVNGDDVVGRFFEYSDGDAYYVDFSNYTKEIVIYNVLDPSDYEVVGMVYDPSSNSYVPNYSGSNKTFMCKVACTLGAMAIAASDGPVPLMDVLAVAYQVACVASCN
jgi:hypothetical protein